MKKTLNIVGCGNVGKVLGRLWASRNTFVLQDILNRSSESAEAAVAFIGSGRATSDMNSLRQAEVLLIATPDDQIVACCEQLAQRDLLSPKSVVFHCSGALPSSALLTAIHRGASVASVHPIRSFASPEHIVQHFVGTFCGIEGDQYATDILTAAFSNIGANLVPIDPQKKILYHGAAVFASNYLTCLLDVAKNMYMQSGASADVALQLMEPLVRETIDNVFHLGTVDALTGPIARNDMRTVERQQREVRSFHPQYGDLYEHFSKIAINLTAQKKHQK
jgi:predicted short-subunit dehydrogenase-like oxidoreductase (DUF2520 family)